MALFHLATITPTKAELIAAWAPTQPWGPPADVPLEVIGAFRFDDPDGRVGMETHLVSAGDTLLQVPLTYATSRSKARRRAFIGEMHHSVLGTRWVYDGLRDPRLVVMLAAVAMTGQGEALGMAVYDDRWYIAPSNVRIQGGGWTQERVPVDRFELASDDSAKVLLRNDRFDLTVYRHPAAGARPPIGLTATWDGLAEPVVLAEVREPCRGDRSLIEPVATGRSASRPVRHRGDEVWVGFRAEGDGVSTRTQGGRSSAPAGQPVDTTAVTTSVPSCVSTATFTRFSTKSAVAARSSPSRCTTRRVKPASSRVVVASSTDSPITSGKSPATDVSVVASSDDSSDPHADTPSVIPMASTTTRARIPRS